MSKKGFTLVELLAVLVILAIISLIAIPIVSEIIAGAQTKTNHGNAKLYKKAIEKAVMSYSLDKDFPNTTCTVLDGGNLDCNDPSLPKPFEIDVSNAKHIKGGGTITFIDKKIVVFDYLTIDDTSYELKNGELVAIKPTDASCFDFTTDKVKSFEINYETCKSALPEIVSAFGGNLNSEKTDDICKGGDGNGEFTISEMLAVPTYRQIAIQYGVVKDSVVIEQSSNATITGYHCSDTDVVIPSTINGHPVAEIALVSFYNKGLTRVTIPNSVTAIRNGAFQQNQLTRVTIPNSVTTIGNGAFASNPMTSLTIGNGVTTIGDNAFHGNQLTSVTIPNSVITIGNSAFYSNEISELTIGNSVTTIGDSAFEENQLTSVAIPNSVITIGSFAFFLNQLSSLTIGNSVTTIGRAAFDSNHLTEVVIPNSVTTIGESAFQYNRLTSTLTIPSSVVEIGNHAFGCGNTSGGLYGPNNLTDVYIDKLSTDSLSIGYDAFCINGVALSEGAAIHYRES